MRKDDNMNYLRVMAEAMMQLRKCDTALTPYKNCDNDDIGEMSQRYSGAIGKIERELLGEIMLYSENIPIVNIMAQVKGVSLPMAVKVVSLVKIEKSPSVSSLWRFAGYGVTNGKAERLRKGEKLHFSVRLKGLCWQIADSMKKCESPYMVIYNDTVEYYTYHRLKWDMEHVHSAANRKMIKVWLSHLWLIWRKLDGLGVSKPYPDAILGHEHIYSPEEFGWPVV